MRERKMNVVSNFRDKNTAFEQKEYIKLHQKAVICEK